LIAFLKSHNMLLKLLLTLINSGTLL